MVLEAEVKSALHLPDDVRTFALMPIGYTDDKLGGVKHRPLGELAFRDQFGNPWRSWAACVVSGTPEERAHSEDAEAVQCQTNIQMIIDVGPGKGLPKLRPTG